MYSDPLPQRVRVLVLGGGIHGVGVLHDMASRGWRDVLLVEKSHLAAGTSSRSTKLIHGGLRYLRNVRDFGLVSEALHERRTLMTVAGDLVSPIELLFPILRSGGMPGFMVKTGLFLYDKLAGREGLRHHQRVSGADIAAKVPLLDQDKCRKVYSFWDAQTDDAALVRRVAASAVKLGAQIAEQCRVERIWPCDDGWMAELVRADGSRHTLSALYVVNALGPWSNRLLERSDIPPTHHGVNDRGVHLLFGDLGLKAGLFLQSPDDGRIFFVLPWQGHTLVGTTEDHYVGDLDDVRARPEDVTYLLERCNRYLRQPLRESEILATFAGLRWLAVEKGRDLSRTSRAYVLGERSGRRGLLVTIYGGKLTTYRRLAQTIGDRLTHHFGEYRESQTAEPWAWASAAETPQESLPLALRFAAPPLTRQSQA